MTAVFVVLATFLGSAALILTATFALMLYQGKAALPRTATAAVLREQGLARIELARAERSRAQLVAVQLDQQVFERALNVGSDEA